VVLEVVVVLMVLVVLEVLVVLVVNVLVVLMVLEALLILVVLMVLEVMIVEVLVVWLHWFQIRWYCFCGTHYTGWWWMLKSYIYMCNCDTTKLLVKITLITFLSYKTCSNAASRVVWYKKLAISCT